MKKNTWFKIIAVDMLMLCFSAYIALTGQMLEAIKAAYQMSLGEAGLLLSVQSIGGITLALACILIIDTLNKQKFLVLCGIVLCISMIIIGLLPPLLFVFVLFVLMGFTGGTINTLTNSVMMETVARKSERHIAFLHMVFSMGAVITPVISQMIYASIGLAGVYIIFGTFALCCSVYAVFAFSGHMKSRIIIEKISLKESYRKAANIISKPGMKSVLAIATMISAWQLTAIYYVSMFFTSINRNTMEGAFALSLLFLSMMIARLIYARIAGRFSKTRVLLLLNLLGMIAWLSMFVINGITGKMIMLGLSALFCGNNFPVVFSSACQIAPDRTAAASGFVTLGYYIAVFAFIPAIGALEGVLGLEYALALCAVPLFLVIPLAAVLRLKAKAI